MTASIIILAKVPTPGRVKTRLAADIGKVKATKVHARLFRHTLEKALDTGLPVTVALDGDMTDDWAHRLQKNGVTIERQCDGDLGQRLKHAMRSPGRHIALGSDCVLFEPEWLLDAARSEWPVVIGPAEDGGYWSITVDNTVPNIRDILFDHMPWSEPSLLKETLQKLRGKHLEPVLLPLAYDVDTLADLQRLMRDTGCPDALQKDLSDLF